MERGRVSGRRALGHHFTLCEIAQESSAQSHGRTPPDVYSCTYTSMAHREPPWQLQRQHVQWTNPRFPLVWPLFANKWWPWSWQRKCVTDICSRAPGLSLMTLSPATSSSYPEASRTYAPLYGVSSRIAGTGWNKGLWDIVRPLRRQPGSKHPDVCIIFFLFSALIYQIVEQPAGTKERTQCKHAHMPQRRAGVGRWVNKIGRQIRVTASKDTSAPSALVTRWHLTERQHRTAADRQLYPGLFLMTLDFVSPFTSPGSFIPFVATYAAVISYVREVSCFLSDTFHPRIPNDQNYTTSNPTVKVWAGCVAGGESHPNNKSTGRNKWIILTNIVIMRDNKWICLSLKYCEGPTNQKKQREMPLFSKLSTLFKSVARFIVHYITSD